MPREVALKRPLSVSRDAISITSLELTPNNYTSYYCIQLYLSDSAQLFFYWSKHFFVELVKTMMNHSNHSSSSGCNLDGMDMMDMGGMKASLIV